MKYLYSSIITLALLLGCNQVEKETLFDRISIEIRDTSRTFLFTNKKSGFYLSKTNLYNPDSLLGWFINEKRIFNDYEFLINNKPLERINSVVTIYPDMLQREYGELQEEFFLPDGIDLIIIKLKNLETDSIDFDLTGFNKYTNIIFEQNIVNISLDNFIHGINLYITSDCNILNIKKESKFLTFDTKDKDSLTVLINLSSSSEEIKKISNYPDQFIYKKKDRIQKLLDDSYILTNDEEVNQALLWAKISLDNLITSSNVNRIVSGIPLNITYNAFNNFFSLPGAALVQGKYETAKNILLEFAKLQDKNPKNKFYGRINDDKITTQNASYNPVNATSLFVIRCYDYFDYSGDIDFLRKIYPDIKLAFESTIKNSTDKNGFFFNQDLNNVNNFTSYDNTNKRSLSAENQVLWYKQLTSSFEIGNLLGDSVYAKKYISAANRLKINFQKYFIDTTKNRIYNCVNLDETKVDIIRPNQFIVLNEPDLFKNSIERLKILANLTQSLVFPYGVLSLTQDNKNFYPFFTHTGNNCNGLIWQWNTGPAVQILCGFGQQNTAWQLTEELTFEIINMGTVGTLAQFMDAYPKNDNKDPDLNGDASYSLTLAEYIRNFYQDYLGVKTDAYNKALYLLPTLPNELNDVEFDQNIGKDKVRIHYSFTNELDRITISTISLQDSIDVGVAILNKADANFQMKTSYHENDKLVFEVPSYSNSLHDLKVFRNGNRIPITCQIYNEPPSNYALYQNIKFAEPLLKKENLESMDTLRKTPLKLKPDKNTEP